ncbi:MFS transporter [Saccharopolyspora sp. NPDC049357]|uniref:MFS transporter n=1 Tax=Saccharopolyspora sp. NPDC049357 TaxID=3154507 RepID=UPI00344AF636
MRRSCLALLVALGVDDFGSGLFLPLALVYATRVVGIPLALAGIVVAAGTLVGFLVPPVAGRLVDRVGPRTVVIAAQLMQALGALSYLVADGVAVTFLAAIMLAAGLQLFYCALFSLIADVYGEGAKDRPFAIVGMVRSACFGLGALAGGGLLSTLGATGLRLMVGVNALSFIACALVLALLVQAAHASRDSQQATEPGSRGVLQDRPFLMFIAVTALLALASDFFLVGVPVYVLEQLTGPAWLPGLMLALLTASLSIGGTAAVRATRYLARTTTLAISAGLYVVWCLMSLAAVFITPAWLPAFLLSATLLQAAAALLSATRVNALAEAAAPPEMRGRYLATFQYAFTIPRSPACLLQACGSPGCSSQQAPAPRSTVSAGSHRGSPHTQ